MRISGPHGTPLPAPSRARGIAAPQSAELAGPVEPGGPAEADAPARDKARGLVRAADHSHRSDVATLRQWITHPELRSELTLPDLAAEHKGNGFQKAVAAYQAAVAIANPTPPADPAPVTDPAPVVTDPAPVVTDPPPAASDPVPVTTDQPAV